MSVLGGWVAAAAAEPAVVDAADDAVEPTTAGALAPFAPSAGGAAAATVAPSEPAAVDSVADVCLVAAADALALWFSRVILAAGV